MQNVAEALWNQRARLGEGREKILALCQAVGRPGDLWPSQWAQMMALALEFQPDFVLELGRGYGNSTAAFTQAAHLMPQPCRVLSLCLSDYWSVETVPRLRSVVEPQWFAPLRAECGDILGYNFEAALTGAKRVLVFWDAHGFEVAECVLGRILPLVQERPHLVLMHDICDARYPPEEAAQRNRYDGQRLWKGNNWDGPMLRLGDLHSPVEQAVAILDFTTRNALPLHSADHDLNALAEQPDKMAALRESLGDLFSLQACWRYFSLNQCQGAPTFPRFEPPALPQPHRLPLARRLKLAAKLVLNRPVEGIQS